jgi:AraC-like DNA-binding protein
VACRLHGDGRPNITSQPTGPLEPYGPTRGGAHGAAALKARRLARRVGARLGASRAATLAEPFIPLVRAKALERLPHILEKLGARFEDILRRVGLPNVPLDRPDAFLPFRDVLAVVAEAERQTGHDHLSLQLATAGGVDALGDYGSYITIAATLQEAIARAGQYVGWHALCSRLSLTLEGSTVVWRYHLSTAIRDDRRHAYLFSLAVMRNVVRLAAGSSWMPAELRVEAGPAKHPHELTDAFGDRIMWNAGENALVFPEALLACRIASNPRRSNLSDEVAVGLAAAPPPPGLVGSLRPLIRSLLPAGCPGVALVARLSGLSLRSFQRELAEAGLSFSELVEQARLELALSLMRDPAIPLTEVALELGYSDSANFTRAFRRWTGLAPRRYRQAALWAAASTSPMPAGPGAPA